MKKGFTLIELLVVVLIIGILAAVAVPQYQKAVEKSRYALSQQTTRALADAQERFYLSNGTYTTDIDALDLSLPGTYTMSTEFPNQMIFDWGYCGLQINTVFCRYNKAISYLQIYYQHSTNTWVPPGSKVCVAYSLDVNNVGNQVCKQQTQQDNFYAQNATVKYTEWLYPN